MPFFDVTATADLALIRPMYREVPSDSLAVLAKAVELDVIGHYTVDVRIQPSPSRVLEAWTYGYVDTVTQDVVCLRGFNPDPTICQAGLAATLKYVIAEVLNWRLANREIDPTVTSKTKGNEKTMYRTDANSLFPLAWNSRLLRYDLTPVVWGF